METSIPPDLWIFPCGALVYVSPEHAVVTCENELTPWNSPVISLFGITASPDY